MPDLISLAPAELREQLEASPPPPGVILASPIYLDDGEKRDAEANRRAWAAHIEARRAVEAWGTRALSDGDIVAHGFEPGAKATERPVTIPREQWRRLCCDLRSNAATCAATGRVVLTGLDFTLPAPQPCDLSAVADEFLARGERPQRAKFRAACRGAKYAEIDSVWEAKFNSNPGEKLAKVGAPAPSPPIG